MDNGGMRLIWTMVLVGGVGCTGDDRTIVDPPDMLDMEPGEFGETVPITYIAEVCDQRTWDITPDAKNLDLQVVRTDSGATVLTVPKDGGAVRAFRVDQRGDLIDRDMVTLRDDQNFTSVSGSVAAERFVVASVVGDKVLLDIFRDDLGARHELAEVSGTLAADSAVLTARETQIALVGGADGVTANGFAGGLWESTTPVTVTKDPVVSITAAPFIDDTILAWSTTSKTCHVQRFAGKQESVQPFGCNDARIAMNASALRGQLVFVEEGIVYRSDIVVGGEIELANKVRIAEFASSPRVAFDGSKFWISYINVHGDVVAGFVDSQGRFASRALEGTRPDAEAYDLSVFSDGPWVVNTTDSVLAAKRMCARPL
jgi:hypothetical protein